MHSEKTGVVIQTLKSVFKEFNVIPIKLDTKNKKMYVKIPELQTTSDMKSLKAEDVVDRIAEILNMYGDVGLTIKYKEYKLRQKEIR